MRKVDWMADTGAKTQSSDKTNPPSVSEMTPLYLNGFTLTQHKAMGPGKQESVRGSVDVEESVLFFICKNPGTYPWQNYFLK